MGHWLPNGVNAHDIERALDRLLRRVEELESVVGVKSYVGTEPVSESKLEGRVAMWIDRENGKLKIYDGQKIREFSED